MGEPGKGDEVFFGCHFDVKPFGDMYFSELVDAGGIFCYKWDVMLGKKL